MRESTIEAWLVRGVEGRGGLCYKFVSPGNKGVPDRIVITPDGRTEYVELKSPTGRLSPMQKFQRDELKARNVTVHVLNSVEQVEKFMREVMPL